MNNYVLPNKDLLEKRSEEIEDNKNYYSLSKLIYQKDFDKKLTFPIGIDNDNIKHFGDLENKSGMFIYGETGSGKSIFLNSIIISLLLKNTPSELQFLFIDPKGIELNIYNTIPSCQKMSSTLEDSIQILEYLLNVIEDRRKLFIENKVKNINNYNLKSEIKIPHIMLVIDEGVDILNEENNNKYLSKILLEGYKYGLHLILSTNSHFKDNFNKDFLNLFDYIITFDLANKEQAKFIELDDSNLLGIYGEAMMKEERTVINNIQTPYISLEEIQNIVNYINEHNTKRFDK